MNVGFVRTDGSCVGLMLCLLFGRKSGRELCSVVGLRFELDFFFFLLWCWGDVTENKNYNLQFNYSFKFIGTKKNKPEG